VASLIVSLFALGLVLAPAAVSTPAAAARDVAPRDSLVTSLDVTPLSPNDIVIDSTGTYAYVATCTRSASNSYLLRLDLSTFTVDDSATMSTDCARSVAMSDDSIYVTTNDRLYRFAASTFGPSGPSTSDYVAIDNYGNALDVHGSYAYIGHHAGNAGNQITKVNVAGPTMTVASTFPSGGTYPMSLEIDPIGTFAYVTHTVSHSLAKIRLSDDSVVGSIQVGQQPYGLALDNSGSYAYVPSAAREAGSPPYTTPPWLVRVRLSDFTFDDSVTLPFYWGFSVDVNSAGTTAYVGQDREGANVAKVSLGPSMSIEETITVQNSPSSLAISPTAPFLYTANSADLNGRTVSKVVISGITPAPTVSSLSVSSGPLTGGGTVTISGDNLTGATGVDFGGAAATILSGSDDTVAVTVPGVGGAGDRNVTVTTPGGTSAQVLTYTYVAAPTVTSLLPANGPTSGGTTVTITGTDLSAATVTLGGVPVTTSANTATSIEFTTGPKASGTYAVDVTTVGGAVSAGSFTYLAPPAPPRPIPPSAPGVPTAIPGSASAHVTWEAVAWPGSYPVSAYRVTSSPAAGNCLVTTLSCEITGLTNGTAYTFRVQALSGAGWGEWSPESAPVTPMALAAPTISIIGTRAHHGGRAVITVTGDSNLAQGTVLHPWIKRPRERAFTQGSAAILADEAGSFTWSRRAAGPVTVYVRTIDGSARSNRIAIR